MPSPGVEQEPAAFAAHVRGAVERSEAGSGGRIAFAVRWHGRPFHARLAALARAIRSHAGIVCRDGSPLVLIFDGDLGRALGEVLRTEVGWRGPLVCLDGISVGEFDFVDIGSRRDPSGTFPVVVKSLVFPTPTDVGQP
jgi:ethanolamine utilization protein EutA